MTFLLGLTGNIACGKSTVGDLLTEYYGAEYVDADRVVHSLYDAGTTETQAIAERFGRDLLQPDGTIDRRRLGDIVMADPIALRDLEQLLAPGIRHAIESRLAAASAPVVVLDAIRLIEAGLAARCDAVWVVTCDRDLQLQRLQQSRGLSLDQAALRVGAQAPAEDKVRYATEVVRNQGSVEELTAQVRAAWERDVAPRLTSE